MSTSALIIGIASVVGALGFLLLAIRSLKARSAQGVIDEDQAPQGKGGKLRSLLKLGASMRPDEDKKLGELKRRAVHAGLYSQEALDLFLTVRLCLWIGALFLSIVLALVMLGGGGSEGSGEVSTEIVLLWLLLFMGIFVAAFLGPSFWLDARKEARQREIGQSLPHTLDLLAVSLDAGLGLQQALERVSAQRAYGSDLLASELRHTLAEIRAGVPLGSAFEKFAGRIGMDEINTLALLISQTATFGTNISKMIREHIKVFRQNRLLLMEEKAGQANAKLTLPLTLLLLPAVLALLVGPAVIQIARTF